jgi:hypothetical protein
MNNVFSRIVALLGFRQMGGLFDEAQYFIAGATGHVFMRSHAGEIFLRTVEPDGIYSPGPFLPSPYRWQWVRKLPRDRRSIAEAEAFQPPDGWKAPERFASFEGAFASLTVESAEPSQPRGRTALDDPGEDTPPPGYRIPNERRSKWEWTWPW